MYLDSTDTLLAVLRRSELFSREQVEEVVRELVPSFPDPLELGQYLVEIDWLTAYQLQLLLGGQWNDLTIGPFQVLDRLGEGGVSEVFKAWDTLRGRVVALKVLRQDLADQGHLSQQFQRELRAVTRLNHPNVIKIYDANQIGSLHYFAMELIEGMDLAKYVEQVGPIPIEEACEYIRQVAQGLQHAHQCGLVHRDIKPANLFLLNPPGASAAGRKGQPPMMKILDWGLARCMKGPAAEASPTSSGDSEKGRLIGTAEYIAPEQARDPTLVDIRADIYSLGCTLYFLLTGRPPFPGRKLMQILHAHQEESPPSLLGARPDVPAELDAICQKMLEKVPDYRYQIPLLVVSSLRRFAGPALARPGQGGSPSSAVLARPGSAAALPTTMNLSRPQTHTMLGRPGDTGLSNNGMGEPRR